MPLNLSDLTNTLKRMKDLYVADPTHAVRSKEFITEFQNYCATELRARGLESNGLKIQMERKIIVDRGRVEADIGLFDSDGDPKLVVDVRSQMSSLGKNFNNYIRMKAGEVESIHQKYPNCVVGLIYIHPTGNLETKKPVNPVGSFNYVSAAKQLVLLSGREATSIHASLYENVAYCVVDFKPDPPKLSISVPMEKEIRLENFFDKVSETLKKR
jgi:hypothetical protein